MKRNYRILLFMFLILFVSEITFAQGLDPKNKNLYFF